MSDSDDFSEIDCDPVTPGLTGRVLMLRSVTNEFLELEVNKQARLMSNMKIWADGYKLTQEQFNGNEGRCGGSNDGRCENSQNTFVWVCQAIQENEDTYNCRH